MRKLAPLELAVVVPTFNERGNVAELVARLDRALAVRFRHGLPGVVIRAR